MFSSKHVDKVGVIISFDLFIENVDLFHDMQDCTNRFRYLISGM